MDSRLKKLGEFGLIDRIAGQLPSLPAKRWVAGIGDDASVLRINEHHFQLFTHDLLLEKVHFVLERPQDFSDLGWKALAVNLSDVAAMGGVPQEAVVGLGIPARATLGQIDALYQGLGDCAKLHHCRIVGGDTTRSPSGWVVSVAITGFSGRLPKLRRGTQAGDSLWVTGTLGGAALGWKARQKKDRTRGTALFRRKQSRPEPRVAWGQRLGESEWVRSMIDLSDGLGGDLSHLAKSGEVGFEVEVDAIPLPKGFQAGVKKLKMNFFQTLLGGGEDYELLFTVVKGKEQEFSKWVIKNNVCAAKIGKAVPGKKITYFYQGKTIKEKITGYRHF